MVSLLGEVTSFLLKSGRLNTGHSRDSPVPTVMCGDSF
jgi:hypothetical protein